jgi:hypothetical protein
VPKRSAKPKLGRLEKLDPTDYWQTQADFQQWLTEPETLELLGEATGLDLIPLDPDEDLDEVSPSVADATYALLAMADTDALALVTAHLGPPTAVELGDILIWAAAEEATAVIWVVPSFSAEVAQTLDWLSQGGGVMVLGLTVELWHIGKTAMAANFIPVCGAVEASPGLVGAGEPEPGLPEPEPEPLTTLQQENLDFWGGLCDRMDRRGSLVKPGSPSTEATMGFAIARAGFRLNAILDRDHGSLYTELLLSGIDAQPHFYLLAAEREIIADEIDLPLIWDDSGESSCVIASPLTAVDLTDRDRWPTYYDWFCDCLERFYEVFFDRIKRLDATAYQPIHRRAAPLVDALVLPASKHH